MPLSTALRPATLSRADVLQLLAFGAAYVVAAKIGFLAAFTAEQVSAVWPPTGLAVWAVLFCGFRSWPAIWIGAFVANTITNVPLAAASGIATGNTLEALLAAWLLRRFVDVGRTLDTLRHVTGFVLAAAVASTTVSATIGVTTLCAAGLQPWSRFGLLWSIWWLGDATGALLVAPVLLTVPWLWRWRHAARRAAEAVALGAATIVVSLLVFVLPPTSLAGRHPLEFAVFPLVIWAGLRFAHPGAALVSAAISCIAVWGTLQGAGPFTAAATSPEENIILLQIFTAVIATSGLVLGGAIADRNRSDRLREADHTLTAVLSEAHDLEHAAPQILQSVCETLDWDVGILWRAANEKQSLEYVDSWRRDPRYDSFVEASRARRFEPGIGLPGRVWASGQAAWIDDVVGDANFPRAAAAAQVGLHGAFAFPILLGRRVSGVLEFFAREPRRIDRSLLSLMAAEGSQLGQFIDRRGAQLRVLESEALNSAIVSAALDCVISIDADGRILEFNPAAAATFGIPRSQALGQELANTIVPHHLRDRHREALRRCVETGEGRILGTRLELPALRADGTEFPIELAITRVGNGPRPVFTAHIRDITERQRAESERADLLARERDARVEAEHANRSKDQFLATVSHELRTPLTAILGWASMLRTRDFEPSRVREIYESVYRNAQIQARIVNDLLDVSRIVTGQLKLDLQTVDLGEVARLSLETIRPAAVAKGLTLGSDIPQIECRVLGDAARLQQVIWNLLSNAIKFTPSGGSVMLTVRSSDALVTIDVSDTGIGISPPSLPRVFERFWQADSTSTRSHSGLGLGLALVRHIVELHGGEVRAQSEGQGQGSTFSVILPAPSSMTRRPSTLSSPPA